MSDGIWVLVEANNKIGWIRSDRFTGIDITSLNLSEVDVSLIDPLSPFNTEDGNFLYKLILGEL